MPTDLRGIIFDMDGTLVDSQLDFNAMRAEMGLPVGAPILETLETLPGDVQQRCLAILERHELAGAERATRIAGAHEFVQALDRRNIPRAVFTRNSRLLTLAVLARLELPFEIIITREDGPPKPDPTSIWHICGQWSLTPQSVAIIGDYHYDIQAGRRAGCQTVLYTDGRDLSDFPWSNEADLLLHSFHDAEKLLFGASS